MSPVCFTNKLIMRKCVFRKWGNHKDLFNVWFIAHKCCGIHYGSLVLSDSAFSCECICFAYGCSVESIHGVVCRTKTSEPVVAMYLVQKWAFGDSALLVALPTSYASFLRFVACLSNCNAEAVLSITVGTCPLKWTGYAEAPQLVWMCQANILIF